MNVQLLGKSGLIAALLFSSGAYCNGSQSAIAPQQTTDREVAKKDVQDAAKQKNRPRMPPQHFEPVIDKDNVVKGPSVTQYNSQFQCLSEAIDAQNVNSITVDYTIATLKIVKVNRDKDGLEDFTFEYRRKPTMTMEVQPYHWKSTQLVWLSEKGEDVSAFYFSGTSTTKQVNFYRELEMHLSEPANLLITQTLDGILGRCEYTKPTNETDVTEALNNFTNAVYEAYMK